MESKFTPISLISLKKILEEHFDEFQELKVWGQQTAPFTLQRDSNFPVALAFNDWPRLKIIFPDEFAIRDDRLLCRVRVGGKKYICLLEHVDEIKKEVTFSNNLFRSESRDEERLVCYPHRNVYLYTPCPKIEVDNLLEFKSLKTPEFQKQLEIKRKFIKRSDKLEEGDLIGMRVFDLSSNGVSIVVSKEELELLENIIDQMEFKLSFQGHYYKITDVKFIHSNHLILPGVRDSKLFKAGLSFKYNEEIFEKNQDLIESSITLEELEKELME